MLRKVGKTGFGNETVYHEIDTVKNYSINCYNDILCPVFESLLGYKVTTLRLDLEFAYGLRLSEDQWELFLKSSGWSL